MRNAATSALVFLGLGTNLGNRLVNLQQAIALLALHLSIQEISSVFETPPWGVTNQPAFLNICLSAETTLTPNSLLNQIKHIEKTLGREPGLHWGPRLIDIDILFYNNLIFNTKRLTIPHALMAERAFVLAPLAEIAPDLAHPQTGLTVKQMLIRVDTTGIQKLSQLK